MVCESQPFAGTPEVPPSQLGSSDDMTTADAVLESVNLSDTPSAVAGRIEREEAIQMLKGKRQSRDSNPSLGQQRSNPGPSPQRGMSAYNNPLANSNNLTPRDAGGAGGGGAGVGGGSEREGGSAANGATPNGGAGGMNKGQIQVRCSCYAVLAVGMVEGIVKTSHFHHVGLWMVQVVGEARLGAQLTVKGIRGIDRTGQWRFQWQRVWKQGRGQEKVETLAGAKGPHHQVTAEDCGCRLRVVSARRLPNGQVDRTILYALSSFIPPLEAMQVYATPSARVDMIHREDRAVQGTAMHDVRQAN